MDKVYIPERFDNEVLDLIVPLNNEAESRKLTRSLTGSEKFA